MADAVELTEAESARVREIHERRGVLVDGSPEHVALLEQQRSEAWTEQSRLEGELAKLRRAASEMAGCLRRSMASDERLDLPFDEDAAEALLRYQTAVMR